MNITVKVISHLKIPEVKGKVERAGEKALKDVISDIAEDTIKGSPFDTGNNRRSIRFESGGLSGSVYSTSGYGGYLETGTRRMPARPYFKPALDKNIKKLPGNIKANLR
jgi:HK97 gp10 family phage protein